MHNFESPGDAFRWSELVDQLEGRLDILAQAFTARVRQIPEYGESQVTVLEIRDTARETFRRLIHGLRGPAETARDGLLDFASDLGSKRARAGIPPESLTSAVRLDFSILWADLLEIAAPQDAGLLASRVDLVWRVVDEFATRTHMSYLTERVRMAQEESSIQHEFIARLFNQSTPSAETSSQVGAALGIGPEVRCGLVAASGEAGARLHAAATQFGAAQRRQKIFLHESGGNTYLFWPLLSGPPAAGRSRDARSAPQLPPLVADIPCGYVPQVHGLRGLPAAARTAESLAALLRPGDAGPLSADAAWSRLAQQNLQDAGLDLAAQLEESLEECRGGERERLRETVQHYLSTGNITATAEQLFCHRNTILNRLNRFQELTGIDLTIPAQAARLVVAWA